MKKKLTDFIWKRRNISTDDETERLLEAHDINASEAFRKLIKDNYGSIHMLEQKRDELEQKKERLTDEIYDRQKQKNEVDKELSRINSLLTENRVLEQIKQNDKHRQKFNEAVTIIKREKRYEDEETVETMISKHAEVISDQFGYEEDKIEKALSSVASLNSV